MVCASSRRSAFALAAFDSGSFSSVTGPSSHPATALAQLRSRDAGAGQCGSGIGQQADGRRTHQKQRIEVLRRATGAAAQTPVQTSRRRAPLVSRGHPAERGPERDLVALADRGIVDRLVGGEQSVGVQDRHHHAVVDPADVIDPPGSGREHRLTGCRDQIGTAVTGLPPLLRVRERPSHVRAGVQRPAVIGRRPRGG
ncbi:hypothetical protein GCM10027289_00530 [Tsukamurella serpentis]